MYKDVRCLRSRSTVHTMCGVIVWSALSSLVVIPFSVILRAKPIYQFLQGMTFARSVPGCHTERRTGNSGVYTTVTCPPMMHCDGRLQRLTTDEITTWPRGVGQQQIGNFRQPVRLCVVSYCRVLAVCFENQKHLKWQRRKLR